MQVEPRAFPLSCGRCFGESRYTSGMDRVRFGRAIGMGARQAAKSLMSAAEAATAENPSPSRPAPRAVPTVTSLRTAASRIPVPEPKVVKAHARSLKKSVWKPFAKFTTVLWLEVTGTFFAIFAVVTGVQAWNWRGAIRLAPSMPDAKRLYVYLALFALFAYFTVSSFVRAGRRSKS
jgi:hypothetical protein